MAAISAIITGVNDLRQSVKARHKHQSLLQRVGAIANYYNRLPPRRKNSEYGERVRQYFFELNGYCQEQEDHSIIHDAVMGLQDILLAWFGLGLIGSIETFLQHCQQRGHHSHLLNDLHEMEGHYHNLDETDKQSRRGQAMHDKIDDLFGRCEATQNHSVLLQVGKDLFGIAKDLHSTFG